MPKVGDVVKYRYFNRTVNALVLAVRAGEVSHRGANDEPLLTLALVDPEREKMIAPQKKLRVLPEVTAAQVFIEHDVVHHSHEFDAEFLKKHGSSTAQVASQRGHGEWLTMAEAKLEELAAQVVADVPSAEDLPEGLTPEVADESDEPEASE